MQALKLTIPGDFWDVQVYRGRLHLWKMSGSVLTVDWTRLVDAVSDAAASRLAVRIGFSSGETLYGEDIAPLRAESEFRTWLLSLFERQQEQTFVVNTELLSQFVVDEQDNPFHNLPIDTEIYLRKLYASTDDGLWRASLGSTKHPISTRPVLLADFSPVSMKAHGYRLAMAATSDGLFETMINPIEPLELDGNIRQLSDRHCDGVDWAFSSVFATSTMSGGFLVGRYWESDRPDHYGLDTAADEDDWGPTRSASAHRGLVEAGIFEVSAVQGALPQPSLSWAGGEKVYTIDERQLATSRFVQQDLVRGLGEASAELGRVDLEVPGKRPLAAGASTFGTVIEFDDSLLVVSSDASQSVINEPVTRWRTYPRSTHYQNHLHLIFDDHIDVLAFYGDYLIDQREKRFGSEYRMPRRR